MYFSAEDRGEMKSMVYNWPAEQVLTIICVAISFRNSSFTLFYSAYDLVAFELDPHTKAARPHLWIHVQASFCM